MAPTLEVWNAGKQMAQKMVAFINQSPSAFHAVEQCRKRLEECGFQRLSEKQSWVGKLQANGRYYFTRNNSSIVAFAIGGKYQPQNGFKIIGAHTDSPNLQVKPVSATGKAGYQQVSRNPPRQAPPPPDAVWVVLCTRVLGNSILKAGGWCSYDSGCRLIT